MGPAGRPHLPSGALPGAEGGLAASNRMFGETGSFPDSQAPLRLKSSHCPHQCRFLSGLLTEGESFLPPQSLVVLWHLTLSSETASGGLPALSLRFFPSSSAAPPQRPPLSLSCHTPRSLPPTSACLEPLPASVLS